MVARIRGVRKWLFRVITRGTFVRGTTVHGVVAVLTIPRMDRRLSPPAIAIGICSLLIPLVLAFAVYWTMGRIEAPRADLALILAESGGQSALGAPAGRGAMLALRAGDGPPVFNVARMDTQGSPARAAQFAAAAVGSAVIGLGFTDSDPALAAVPAFTKAGKPFIVIGATDPALPARCGAGTFLACFGDDAQAHAAAEFGAARFGTRALVIGDTRHDYPRALAGFFREHLAAGGRGTVALELDLSTTPADKLGALLAGHAAEADFVFVACEPEDIAGILGAVRGALPAMPVIGGDSFDCDAALRVGGAPLDRVWFTAHAWLGEGCTPASAAFVDAYRKAYGAPPPNGFAALGYDAAQLALDARRRAGNDDPKALAAALAATRGFEGVTGTIGYDRGPVPRKDVWIVEVAAGQRRLAERHAAR